MDSREPAAATCRPRTEVSRVFAMHGAAAVVGELEQEPDLGGGQPDPASGDCDDPGGDVQGPGQGPASPEHLAGWRLLLPGRIVAAVVRGCPVWAAPGRAWPRVSERVSTRTSRGPLRGCPLGGDTSPRDVWMPW